MFTEQKAQARKRDAWLQSSLYLEMNARPINQTFGALISLYDTVIDMTIRQAQKIRIYPTNEQKQQLASAMGCCRWWWNLALNKSIETYKETGKGLSRSALNALLPNLKKENEWLKTEVYSQSLQQTSLNLSRAFIN